MRSVLLFLGRCSFTLLLVFLLSAVLPGRCACMPFHGSSERIAETQLHHIAQALDAYQSTEGRLPPHIYALTEASRPRPALLEHVPLDPWGEPFEYTRTGATTYVLRSSGEDGLWDTEDDLVWPYPDEH